MKHIVLNLVNSRAIWARIPDWAEEEFRAVLPEGWELEVVRHRFDASDGDDQRPGNHVLDAVKGATVYIGFGVPEPIMQVGEDTLEWVHSGAAGVGGSLHETMHRSDALFTNSAGVHGPPIAETVLGMLLYFARGFDFAVTGMREGAWNDEPFLAADSPLDEISEMTVGILGYGGIGREIGKRITPLGARVLGLRRSRPDREVDEYGVELLHGENGMNQLLAESDAVVVAAPDTPETRGILSGERIRTLRKGAVVVNIARGTLVDEDALVEALKDGHLRGAGLDVFAEEPLAPGHPLWTLPNVFITPHISGITRGFWRREMDLVLENFRRFVEGELLLNQVDRNRGY